MPDSQPNITVFGSFSNFTFVALKHLLKGEFNLDRLVIHGYGPRDVSNQVPSKTLFHSTSPEIVELCQQHSIPLSYSLDQDIVLEEILSEYPSAIFLIACYPEFLQPETIQIATTACINIHPSILPNYRGSDPIFWQLRNGESDTGVTLHKVTSEIDGGPILRTLQVAYPDGVRIESIEEKLISAAVEGLQSLLATDASEWQMEIQDHTADSWYAPPCEADLLLVTDFQARTAWNFIRAYAKSTREIKFVDDSGIHRINDALKFEETPAILDTACSENTRIAKFIDGDVVVSIEKDTPKTIKYRANDLT